MSDDEPPGWRTEHRYEIAVLWLAGIVALVLLVVLPIGAGVARLVQGWW